MVDCYLFMRSLAMENQSSAIDHQLLTIDHHVLTIIRPDFQSNNPVHRVTLGGEQYNIESTDLEGVPSVAMAIYQLSGISKTISQIAIAKCITRKAVIKCRVLCRILIGYRKAHER